MSWTAVAWAKAQRTGSATNKVVLLTLAECADHTGENCYPSHRYIAYVCECSERTVERAIQQLEALKLLTRVRRRREDGKFGGYSYRLPIEQARLALGEPTEDPPDNLSSGQNDQRTNTTPATRQIRHQPPDTVSGPEPAIEPPREPGENARAREAVDNSEQPDDSPPGSRKIRWGHSTLNLSAAPTSLSDDAIRQFLAWREERRLSNAALVIHKAMRELARAEERGWSAEDALAHWMTAGWSTFQAEYLDRMRAADTTNGAAVSDEQVEALWSDVIAVADRGGTIADIDKRVMGVISAMGGPQHLASLNETQRAKAREKFAERLRLERERRTAAAGG